MLVTHLVITFHIPLYDIKYFDTHLSPNPSPFSFIPLAKMISKHMDWFPQRLDKIFCSPVPLAASIGWKVVKRFLKPVVVAKINIYWGSSSINSLPPKEFEEDYFEQSTMSFLEKERRSEFC